MGDICSTKPECNSFHAISCIIPVSQYFTVAFICIITFDFVTVLVAVKLIICMYYCFDEFITNHNHDNQTMLFHNLLDITNHNHDNQIMLFHNLLDMFVAEIDKISFQIASYVILRNISQVVRSYHSLFFTWVGKFSLEVSDASLVCLHMSFISLLRIIILIF